MTDGVDSNQTPQVNPFREYVTAAIALTVILGAVLLIANTFRYVAGGSPEDFQRAKDLLLFVNPVLGLVIGFYFNKASTEPRAEQAEARAEQASSRAEEASEARQQAAAAAGAARQEALQATSALEELSDAAQQVLEQLPTAESFVSEVAGPAGAGAAVEATPPRAESVAELGAALRRARQVVRRGGP